MGKDLKGKELGSGIRQRKDGRYEGRYVDRFGERRIVYDRDLKKLKVALNEAIYKDANNQNVVNSTIKLDDWYAKWMTIHKYKTLRENSKLRYVNLYKKHISPYLGKRKISDIKQLDIKDLLRKLDKQGFGFETKNAVRILLLDMFNKAMIDDLVIKNPARGISLKRDENKEVRVLSLEEQALFFDYCKGTFYDNFFNVAISTGMRIGEIAALKWEDIDFEKNLINVNKTLIYAKFEEDKQKEFHFGAPKTLTSTRMIPINRQCEIALKKQYIQKNVIASKSVKKVDAQFKDLLFTTSFNTPINAQNIVDAIRKIVIEINVMRDFCDEIEFFSCHCFRHTFATRCFEAGIQPKTVQSYLGHATLQMTMDLYTSVLREHQVSEMDKLNLELEKISTYGEELVDSQFEKKIKKSQKVVNLY